MGVPAPSARTADPSAGGRSGFVGAPRARPPPQRVQPLGRGEHPRPDRALSEPLADGIDRLAGRTVTLKLRYGDFRTVTRSRTSPDPLDGGTEIARVARALFAQLDIAPGVRLLGVSVGALGPATARQRSLDALVPGAPSEAGRGRRDAGWQEAGQAVDAIRERFGQGAIGPGVLASPEGLDTLRRGARAWGPDES